MNDAHERYVSYFLDNREQRIEALRNFLVKLDVSLSLEGDGVKAVSAWSPVYADLLVDGLQHPESEDLWCAYNWFQAPWTGSLVGLNPIFDLGVYMGEYMLQRNMHLKWQLHIGPEPKKGAAYPIQGQRRGRGFDPIKWTYTESRNTHSRRMAKRALDLTIFFRVI